ncbi:MAG: hypothetical protein U0491_01615 [Candidatus Saccharimonadales bacterium]
MGTDLFVVLNDNANASLSIRTIFGTILAVFILLIASALFKKYKEAQEVIFVLLVGVIVLASTVLVTSALSVAGVVHV